MALPLPDEKLAFEMDFGFVAEGAKPAVLVWKLVSFPGAVNIEGAVFTGLGSGEISADFAFPVDDR